MEVEATFGRNDLLVRSECQAGAGSWGFDLKASVGTESLQLELPQRVQGALEQCWFYAGPFESGAEPEIADLMRLDRVYQTNAAQQGTGAINASQAERTYWRLDQPDTFIRPYYENAMLSNKWTVGSVTNYGRWDYPLGLPYTDYCKLDGICKDRTLRVMQQNMYSHALGCMNILYGIVSSMGFQRSISS